ncbi:MAG: Vms1/Ankzf1 family peptidyl-tRNA hydrolase [Candidatus Nanosalina sp.]
MKLPWDRGKEEKIRELEEKISELEEEKQKLEKQYEAEKERRSKLASEKQQAEEERNRLKDKLEGEEEIEEKYEKSRVQWDKLKFTEFRKGLKKLDSMESPEKDLITVLSPEKVEELPDLKGLKNSLDSESYGKISSEEGFAAFMDNEFFTVILKSRPFFQPEWTLDSGFNANRILDFIETEKHWALVSANKTQVFHEEDGKWEKVEEIKNRVEKQQKKGGFSQGRFERKRDEQIQQHLDQTRELLEDLTNVKLLGEKSHCEDLPGEYLGGFDSSQNPGPGLFYNFQIRREDT